MNAWRASLVLLLMVSPLAAQQQQNPPQQQKRPTLGKEPEGRPPTLGGESPSIEGPRSSKVQDVQKLLRVRTIYIESIDNRLDQKITEVIADKGPLRVVADRKDADAVLQGTCFDSPRLKNVHSEVFLKGRNGESIWQDVIHERYKPPPLTQAVNETAQAIVKDLKADLRDAER
jgi:hypothetical protein